MSKRVQPALVGVFVVAGVASAIGLAILFGSGIFNRNTVTLLSFFGGDVSGLREGSPVTFRGVTVGSVRSVLLSLPHDPRNLASDVRVAVLYDLDLQQAPAISPEQEWNLKDPAQLEALIQAGFRIAIKTTNLLAGTKSLMLDIRPDVPDNRLRGVHLPYPEVPTIPSPIAALEARMQAMLTNIAGLPLDSILNNIDGLVTDLRSVLNSDQAPEVLNRVNATLLTFSDAAAELTRLMEDLGARSGDLAKGVDTTLADARSTLASMDSTLSELRAQTGAESPLSYRMLELLKQAEMTVRSMRELIDYLQANPSAILRGRGGGEEPMP